MRRNGWICGALLCALGLMAALSLLTGGAEISPAQWWGAITGQPGLETVRVILLSIRLPRTLCALVAGAGLSLSGVLLQTVMGNDLAGPNIIGVNAGAGLAVAACLFWTPALHEALPFAAFVGAFAAALLILLVARLAGQGKGGVILAGIACTTLFQAGISFLNVLDGDVLSQYSAFAVGGFAGVAGRQLVIPAVVVGVCMLVSLMLSGRIAALSLGDEIASGLGIRPWLLRILCMLLASLSAAAVVSFAGLLGFVGLVAPHMARKICGPGMRSQLTAAPLLGALLVTASDWAGRTWFYPSEVSVGILMAFVGAPFFLALLLSKRRRRHAGM